MPGQSVTATVGIGWFKVGTPALTFVTSTPKTICTPNGSKLCTASVSFGSSMMKGPTNGSWAVSNTVSGTLTGATCAGPATPSIVIDPPPPCEGQVGQVNGLTVCIPTESPAAKAARAAAAAAAAASSASTAATAAAIAAGVSPAAAAAAGAAAARSAGAAASSAVMSGASSAAAAASGAAAGAAAGAATASGATAAAANSAAAAAAAKSAATAAATSAGLSPAAVAAAGAAAAAAAQTASATAISAGATPAAAAAAAKAAGDAAAASIAAAAAKAAGDAIAAAVAAGKTKADQDAAAAVASDAAAASTTAAADAAQDATEAAAADAAEDEVLDEVDPIEKYCEDHPASAMCKEKVDGEFSGSCGAPPDCKGDAILCAIADSTFESNCAMKTAPTFEDTPENSAYEASKLTEGGDQTKDLPGNIEKTISSADFDQTNLLGSSSGMTDVTVTVAGKSVVIALSAVNPHLENLGRVLQAVTFLICAVIVSGLRSRG